jgi:hypothetical protein
MLDDDVAEFDLDGFHRFALPLVSHQYTLKRHDVECMRS